MDCILGKFFFYIFFSDVENTMMSIFRASACQFAAVRKLTHLYYTMCQVREMLTGVSCSVIVGGVWLSGLDVQ